MNNDNPQRSAFLSGTIKHLAGQNRREPTPAEAVLWKMVKNRQISGSKFRRQHPIDRFVVDFCCVKAKLVIEVDGEVHKLQVEADQEREHILNLLGFRVLRFTNEQVLKQPDQVWQKIKDAL